jgi:GNAT superfamily N-acetyltransferase
MAAKSGDYYHSAILSDLPKSLVSEATELMTATFSSLPGSITHLEGVLRTINHRFCARLNSEHRILSMLTTEKSIYQGEEVILFYNVVTRSEWQRKGFASKLIHWVIKQQYPKSRIGLYVLTDNDAAIRIYQRLGFQTMETVEINGRRYFFMLRRPIFQLVSHSFKLHSTPSIPSLPPPAHPASTPSDA